MAQLAIAAIGAVALGPIGLGLTTASTGFMLGSMAYAMLAPGQKTYGPKLNDLKVMGTEYGQVIPWVAGSPRIAGQIVWASTKRETAHEESQGKGEGPSYTSYTYDCDLLILLSENQIAGISRVWSNGELVFDGATTKDGVWADLRVYTGAADQMPDPTYEAAVGAGNAPAYRGRGYVVIQGLQLGGGGNLPNLTFEINGSTPAYDTPNSILCAAIVVGSSYAPDYYKYDPTITSEPTYSDYWSEFLTSAISFTQFYNSGESPTLARSGYPIDVSVPYLIQASNANWTNDVCSFTLQFVDSSNNTVAIIKTDGIGSFSHAVQYAGNSGIFSSTGASAYTQGNIDFLDDRITFTPGGAGGNKGSFTILCAGKSVRAVNISNVRVKSAYTGQTGGAQVIFRKVSVHHPGSSGSNTSIGDAINQLMIRSDYESSDFDFSGLSSIGKLVRGLAIGQNGNTRATLEMLQQAFFFECSKSDKLYVRPRSTSSVATLPFNVLGVSDNQDGDDEPLALTVGNELELPAQISLSYPNMANDYQTGTEFSDRLLSGQESTQAAQMALGMLPAEAKGVVDALLMDQMAALTRTTIKLPLRYAFVEPGDVVTATNNDGRTYRLRVQSKKDSLTLIELECVLDDVGALDSAAITDTGYVGTTAVTQVAPTLFDALDIPILRDADDAPGYYVAVTPNKAAATDEWKGALVAHSWDGVSYGQLYTSTQACVMGTCSTTLPNWTGGNVFDEASTLTVTVKGGELANSTRSAMLLDDTVNAMLVGSEVIRFRNATLVTAGTYVLSGLLRGQRGTEWAMGGHLASEACILLNGSLRRVVSQTNEIGVTRDVKAVTFGQFLSAGVAESFTDTGIALKPFAPANPRALASGADMAVTWQRRTRKSYLYGGETPTVPLGEATESYRVRVFAGATLKRTETTTTPAFTYTASMLTADGFTTGQAVTFEISQVSSIVGAGYPSTVQGIAP